MHSNLFENSEYLGFSRYQDMLYCMRGAQRRVMELVGVKEGYVQNRLQGKVNKRALENEKKVADLAIITCPLFHNPLVLLNRSALAVAMLLRVHVGRAGRVDVLDAWTCWTRGRAGRV
jgi:hypothetical protein